jgi:two-component system chemotaxis response regulator CheY
MLIVDDSTYMQRVISTFVKNLDIKIVGFAEDGEEAIEKYKELRPDIITMDLAMDKMNGMDALAKIKLLDPKAVVIVISSTAGQKQIVEAASKWGVEKFFAKPLDKNSFTDYLKELVAE